MFPTILHSGKGKNSEDSTKIRVCEEVGEAEEG